MRTLKPGRTQVNLFSTRKREHSRKPDEFYDLIEACSPGPYLELFARFPREGWSQWGNEDVEENSIYGVAMRKGHVDDQMRLLEPPGTTGPLRSSITGDVVLDPFCGCGTTIDAAQKLGREWIGIAIPLIKNRLQGTYGRGLRFVSGSGGGTGHWPVPSGDSPDGTAVGVGNEKPATSDVTPFQSAGRRPERAGRPYHPQTPLVRIIGEPTTPADASRPAARWRPRPPAPVFTSTSSMARSSGASSFAR